MSKKLGCTLPHRDAVLAASFDIALRQMPQSHSASSYEILSRNIFEDIKSSAGKVLGSLSVAGRGGAGGAGGMHAASHSESLRLEGEEVQIFKGLVRKDSQVLVRFVMMPHLKNSFYQLYAFLMKMPISCDDEGNKKKGISFWLVSWF